MGVEKIVQSAASQVSSAVSKEGAKALSEVASKLQEATPEKLTSALDGLAGTNQALVKNGKINTVPNRIADLVEDTMKSDAQNCPTAKEALNAAREVVYATGSKYDGPSAAEVAGMFIEKGETSFEKGNVQSLTPDERKVQLREKLHERMAKKTDGVYHHRLVEKAWEKDPTLAYYKYKHMTTGELEKLLGIKY